jgi:hypothetical protein
MDWTGLDHSPITGALSCSGFDAVTNDTGTTHGVVVWYVITTDSRLSGQVCCRATNMNMRTFGSTNII